MFPYHDENATERTAYVTLAIIGLCVVAWLVVQGGGIATPLAASVCNYGLIPAELTLSARPGVGFQMTRDLVCVVDPGRQVANLFTSMFMHGSWMHLLGNMWFLWLFGNNVEDSMTRPRFVAFYLLCGLGAAGLQVWAEPGSIIPMVGASGAISGVMGAYLLLFPRVRVYTLVVLGFYITTLALPAWVMLLYWAFLQFVGGLGSLALAGEGGGVAFWAHVGGFVAGLVLVRLFTRSDRLQAHRGRRYQPRRVGWS